ncbi:MAG: hypothetical protein KJ884_04170 [Gammaproteobacteria bacterium]|nr:hypothetical protein [Gammaproteobacteria bacterium]MBU1490298.1 hypothetical protein [Gammaproteobacteria bacterium]MBU2065444.1 hypothetical protein [Gammaproteobacteria bacterium]MBU2139073.1 hypothetical protein [Gammaproteobacteria bacterium]MBU2215425.1 hypothetical protein [Gammaproteobacteria bacterium]
MRNPRNFDTFLPYGESLRPFLVQPFISKGDLKDLLRKRGVFISNTEKEHSIPALTTNLITPSELETLRLTYSEKEENPKVTSRTLGWTSNTPLIECLPDDINLNQIVDLDFKNYQVTGTPFFTTVGSNLNHVILEFEVERLDKSNSWVEHSRLFKGSIEMIKPSNSGELIITNTHTAPETKEVIAKLSANLVNHFKTNGQTHSEAKINRILFSDFDNAKRFNYFLSLTKQSRYTCITFDENVDAGLSPDNDLTPPPKLEWLKERIKNLNLSGNALDETLFFEEELRNYLILHRLDCRFRFSISGHDGYCVMSFAFPDYSQKNDVDAELEVKIKTISFEDTKNPKEKANIKLTIIKEVEHEKLDKFKKLKLVSL